ncbi:MAG: YegP family protein [Saprospiraceae bacterium]
MGKFVIKQGDKDQYYFSLKAGNGQVILASQGYSSMNACQSGIDSVMINSQDDSQFEKKTSSNGKFYFNLKAGNGQIIGSSEMYESATSRDNGIASVISNTDGAVEMD